MVKVTLDPTASTAATVVCFSNDVDLYTCGEEKRKLRHYSGVIQYIGCNMMSYSLTISSLMPTVTHFQIPNGVTLSNNVLYIFLRAEDDGCKPQQTTECPNVQELVRCG